MSLQYNGDLYVWGYYQNKQYSKPTKLSVEYPPNKDICMTNQTIAVIDVNDNLWSWKSSFNNNELFSENCPAEPEKVLSFENCSFAKVFLGPELIFAIIKDDLP